jgi:hypothetical protein
MSLGQLESSQTESGSLRPQSPGRQSLRSQSVYARATYAPAPARRHSVELASSRAADTNPNHHLWKNGRLWWIAFTLIHDGWRQERIRQSLGTDSELEARRRRDAIFTLFNPGLVNGCVDPEPEAVRN